MQQLEAMFYVFSFLFNIWQYILLNYNAYRAIKYILGQIVVTYLAF